MKLSVAFCAAGILILVCTSSRVTTNAQGELMLRPGQTCRIHGVPPYSAQVDVDSSGEIVFRYQDEDGDLLGAWCSSNHTRVIEATAHSAQNWTTIAHDCNRQTFDWQFSVIRGTNVVTFQDTNGDGLLDVMFTEAGDRRLRHDIGIRLITNGTTEVEQPAP